MTSTRVHEAMTPRLELADVSVQFGGVQAVQRLSLSVAAGEIHGLIGPNGAGKTTVINAITGAVRITSGAIRLDGRDIAGLPAHEISRLGIGRTFQHVEPFGDLSVLDNVLVGAGRSDAFRSHFIAQALALPGARLRERRLRADAMETLDAFGLGAYADVPADRLPFGLLKRMDLARSLAAAPTLLLMDEPTSGMSESEADDAIAAARDIAARRRITLIVVEHNMRVMMALAERITVIQFGAVIAQGTPAEIQSNPQVVDAYLGEPDAMDVDDETTDALR